MRRRSLLVIAVTAPGLAPPAWAHHGWSGFDQTRPIYLEGTAADVAWRNPHVEVVLAVDADLRLPADLAARTLPAQTAAVDGAALVKAARVPTRRDARWEVELAPLSRMQAWQVPEIAVGERFAVLGFTFAEEKGDAVLRAEYLFLRGKVYALRSSPA